MDDKNIDEMEYTESGVIPVLLVTDIEKAKRFYTSLLTFHIIKENVDTLILEYNGGIVKFEQRLFIATEKTDNCNICIIVDNIKYYYEIVTQEKLEIVERLQTKPNGEQGFCVRDPFGFLLRFVMGAL